MNAWKTEIHNECRGPATMDNSCHSYASNQSFHFLTFPFRIQMEKSRDGEEGEEVRISFLNFVNCKKVSVAGLITIVVIKM